MCIRDSNIIIGDRSTNVDIGGPNPGDGNTIRYSGVGVGIGIFFDDEAIQLQGNSIYGNTGIVSQYAGQAIDLARIGQPEFVEQDLDDVDTGGNGLQNAPEISKFTKTSSTSLHIEGTLNSEANADYRIDFYADDNPDDVESKYYLGSIVVTTDGDSPFDASFSFDYSGTAQVIGLIQGVTATATNITTGHTNENATSQLSVANVLPQPEVSETTTEELATEAAAEAAAVEASAEAGSSSEGSSEGGSTSDGSGSTETSTETTTESSSSETTSTTTDTAAASQESTTSSSEESAHDEHAQQANAEEEAASSESSDSAEDSTSSEQHSESSTGSSISSAAGGAGAQSFGGAALTSSLATTRTGAGSRIGHSEDSENKRFGSDSSSSESGLSSGLNILSRNVAETVTNQPEAAVASAAVGVGGGATKSKMLI